LQALVPGKQALVPGKQELVQESVMLELVPDTSYKSIVLPIIMSLIFDAYI